MTKTKMAITHRVTMKTMTKQEAEKALAEARLTNDNDKIVAALKALSIAQRKEMKTLGVI